MDKLLEFPKYMITEEGKLYRTLKSGDIKQIIGSQNGHGYIQVTLMDGKEKMIRLMHRLVAEQYIPNPEHKLMVDHIDENKANNNVDNLRWVTHQENVRYYNTNEGREYQRNLARQRKELLKEYSTKLMAERKEINRLNKELNKRDTALKLKEDVIKNYEAMIAVHSNNYKGFKDTTGIKFGSIAKMVEATGKEITVQGQVFNSCGAAADWISTQEATSGIVRNRDTISKELRRYLQGRRPKGIMYEKYSVGY